jgi:hypothetical protein
MVAVLLPVRVNNTLEIMLSILIIKNSSKGNRSTCDFVESNILKCAIQAKASDLSSLLLLR